MENNLQTIYLAGGCFWGMEKLMKSLRGVKKVTSGYANGTDANDANYETVCRGRTGFREAVRIEYDPFEITIDAILLARRQRCQSRNRTHCKDRTVCDRPRKSARRHKLL